MGGRDGASMDGCSDVAPSGIAVSLGSPLPGEAGVESVLSEGNGCSGWAESSTTIGCASRLHVPRLHVPRLHDLRLHDLRLGVLAGGNR